MGKPSYIVGVMALVLVSACDATGPAKSNKGTMAAVIDGAEWSAVSITTDSTVPSVVIQGSNGTSELVVAIPVSPGPGKQVVGSTTPVFGVLVTGSKWWAASRTQGGAGSVTLTTVEPGHIVGTFEFTMAAHDDALPSERRVRFGRFDVKY